MSTPEGFTHGLVSYLLSWWGFVFTVGGLILAREHWWIAGLIVVANALAIGCFAYKKHRGEAQAKADYHAMAQRLQEVEQRLNEVLSNCWLRQIVDSASLADLAWVLTGHAEVIARQKQFIEAEGRPLPLRTFSRQGDQLFALAKASAAALEQLHVVDPFLLERKTASGVEVKVANLAVHQPPD